MCCGSEDDYYKVTPDRPENQRSHPYVTDNRPRQYPQRQYRTPNRDEAEKRQRQAQAAAAARNYGWPTARGVTGNIYVDGTPGARDSMIEPGLAGGLAAMPGLDFGAVYDPHRTRQSPRQQHVHRPGQPIQRPGSPVLRPGQPVQRPSQPIQRSSQPVHRPTPPPPYQKPAYYQYSFVDKQPGRIPPMRAEPKHEARETLHQRPGFARQPVVQAARPISKTPQMAEIVSLPRRDSNGVSECSDDEDSYEDLRNYTVSPLQSPDHTGPAVYPRTGMTYGRSIGAF